MWLEAIVSKDDLAHILADLTPTSIDLSDGGELELEAPTDVSLVAGQGLRVVCRAKLRWVVLGIHVPVGIESVTVLLTPEIRRAPSTRDSLVFHVRLEALSVAALPSLVEESVVGRINRELEQPGAELAWDFADALSHRFELPRRIHPTRLLDIEVAWGNLRITSEALVLAISVHVHGRPPGPSRALLPIAAGRILPSRPRSLPVPAIAAGVAVLSFGALGFALGLLAGGRNHSPFALS